MKRISDYKGDVAIEMLADLIEPVGEIMTDKEVVSKANEKNKLPAVALALRNHKKAVIRIMAVMTQNDPKTYEPNLFELPAMLLQLLNDPDVMSLFTWQGQTGERTLSGSAMENIEDDGK